MKFATAYVWMKHGKRMRVPGFLGFWVWDPINETIVIVTKTGESLDIRDTKDVDFTIGFILSDEWEFYHGADNPAENVVAS